MYIVLVYISKKSEKREEPSAVGPYETFEEASNVASWLKVNGAHWVKVTTISSISVPFGELEE